MRILLLFIFIIKLKKLILKNKHWKHERNRTVMEFKRIAVLCIYTVGSAETQRTNGNIKL